MENTIVLLSAKLIIVASRDSVVPPLRTYTYIYVNGGWRLDKPAGTILCVRTCTCTGHNIVSIYLLLSDLKEVLRAIWLTKTAVPSKGAVEDQLLKMTSHCTELEGEDGYSTISGSTLEKARQELKEDPNTRGQAVRDLRSRIIQKETDVR